MTDQEKLGKTIRKRLVRMIADMEDSINTVQSWNDNRPDAPPMDCEPERVLLKLARESLVLWDSGKPIETGKLSAQMAEAALRAAEDET